MCDITSSDEEMSVKPRKRRRKTVSTGSSGEVEPEQYPKIEGEVSEMSKSHHVNRSDSTVIKISDSDDSLNLVDSDDHHSESMLVDVPTKYKMKCYSDQIISDVTICKSRARSEPNSDENEVVNDGYTADTEDDTGT